MKEIVRLHGVPLSIISDCGMKITYKFLRKLHDEWEHNYFRNTFYAQIIGKLEKTIQVLEKGMCD